MSAPSDNPFTLAELCIAACAEAWRGDGDKLLRELAASLSRLP